MPQLGLTAQLPSVLHEPSRGPWHMLDRTRGESVVGKWSCRVEAAWRAAKLGRDGFLNRCTFRVSRLIRWTRKSAVPAELHTNNEALSGLSSPAWPSLDERTLWMSAP